jgi:polysaccharide export outer membrane protein
MTSRAWLLVMVSLLLVGCRAPARAVQLPPPVDVSTVAAGDVFVLQLVGEEKLPVEYTVAPDGTVDVPYLARMRVAGLEPQQIADRIRQALMRAEILTSPSVTVSVKAYNSKRVVVSGEVPKGGALPLAPGMTLVQAVSQAGGLTPLGRGRELVLRRQVGSGTRAVVVDYEAITNNEIPDVLLQAGDTIHVPARVF